MTATEYFLGITDTERDRLAAMAASLAGSAQRLLDRIGIAPGISAIDVGCGPNGIIDLLSVRVGAHGRVVGLEPSEHFALAAESAVREKGWANVSIVNSDIGGSGLPPRSFDFAHERLVLMQTPDPQRLLTELVALVKPGGIVAVQEVDCINWICHPSHPAWDALLNAFLTVAAAAADPCTGRKLPAMLRDAGVGHVTFSADVQAFHARHLPALVESVRSAILSGGTEPAELDELLEELDRHLSDPRTLVLGPTLIQAWGRVP